MVYDSFDDYAGGHMTQVDDDWLEGSDPNADGDDSDGADEADAND